MSKGKGAAPARVRVRVRDQHKQTTKKGDCSPLGLWGWSKIFGVNHAPVFNRLLFKWMPRTHYPVFGPAHCSAFLAFFALHSCYVCVVKSIACGTAPIVAASHPIYNLFCHFFVKHFSLLLVSVVRATFGAWFPRMRRVVTG